MTEHRLEGLEPDNLLAFLALLGLLRALEEARPAWRTRVRWSVDAPPLRPVVQLADGIEPGAMCEAAAEGVAALARDHEFAGREDLSFTVRESRDALVAARDGTPYQAALAASLHSDGAVKIKLGKRLDQVEATPLCLQFGQGHQHFLSRLATVPNQAEPPPRGRGKQRVSPESCLAEALLTAWTRPDPTASFRWDPAEDVRYALMFGDPSNAKNKDGAQHGANRLAAIGLSLLPAAPVMRGNQVRLAVPGGAAEPGFSLAWPIWRHAASLEQVIDLLLHPDLRSLDVMARFGVAEVRVSHRLSVGKFMNMTAGRPLPTADETVPA